MQKFSLISTFCWKGTLNKTLNKILIDSMSLNFTDFKINQVKDNIELNILNKNK